MARETIRWPAAARPRKTAPRTDQAPMPSRPVMMVLGSAVGTLADSTLRTRSIMLLAAQANAPAITYGRGLNR